MSKQALPGSRGNMFFLAPEDITIITEKGHPLYDERINLPMDDAMVCNIMTFGIKIPLLVCKEGSKILVVDGRQRLRCSIEANKRLKGTGKELLKVPCIVEHDDDKFGVSVLANEVRRGDSVSVKLAKLQRYLATGKNEQDAAIVWGVSAQCIKNWLALGLCCKPVRDAVDAGTLSATAASKLSKLDHKEQREKLTELLESPEKATVSKASRVAKGVTSTALSKKDIRDLATDTNTPDEFKTFLQYIQGDIDLSKAAKTLPWLDTDSE